MKRCFAAWAASILALSLVMTSRAEQTPFFIGEYYFPNALIIFDNSDSMQDVPYLNPGGISVRADDQDPNCPKGWVPELDEYVPLCTLWERDVMDEEGNPYRDGSGYLMWQVRPDRQGDKRQAYGGNHPSSKLYQAKQALNAILSEVQNVNLGFATYLTQRTPTVMARYFRTTAEGARSTTYPTRWQVLVWKTVTDRGSVLSPYEYRFTWAGHAYVGDVGGHFSGSITESDPAPGSCPYGGTFPITYTVDSKTEVFGDDGQRKGWQWNFSSEPYEDYRYITFTDDGYDEGCAAGQGWNVCDGSGLPSTIWGYHRVTTPMACNLWRKFPPYTVSTAGGVAVYSFEWIETTGDWNADQGQPGYIDPETLEVTPYGEKNGWRLITSPMENILISTSGQRTSVAPARYRHDAFSYPARGDSERPHAWSYVHKTENPDGNWPDSAQPEDFYPAAVEPQDDDGNLLGDDHIIFVNLPPPDTNDAALSHRDKILEFITLERYQDHPRYANRDYTTMPFTRSVTPSQETALRGRATPLAASLRYAKRYYQSYIQKDSQTQIACRYNYIILLTDGLDTADCDPMGDPFCDAPIDAAGELLSLTVDGRPFPVKTYVVGFGLEETQKVHLDRIAQAGGTGEAFLALSAKELADALSSIFQTITEGKYSRSDLSLSRDGKRIYTAFFRYPGWAGHMRGFALLEDGSVGDAVASWGHDEPCPFAPTEADSHPCRGDAGSSLNEQSARTLLTSLDYRKLITVSYSRATGQVSISGATDEEKQALMDLLIDPSDDINGDDAPGEVEDAMTVLRFTADPGIEEGAYAGSRDPAWKLADIYHSTPVIVGPPAFDIKFNGYQEFRELRERRDTVIYVGGNGGMLYAFNARRFDADGVLVDSDGTERWAFIPKMALGDLKSLRREHRFFIDAKPAVADIYSAGGSGTVFESASEDKYRWHTVLISGMRDGGRGYFALDVTDPSAPRPLWEIQDENMGYTWSVPAIGRVRVEGQDRWVAFAGGGWFQDQTDVGNRLYLIDIERGEILKEYVIGDADNHVASSIRDVDLDRDGYVERIYFGDVRGVLWRMDLTDESPENWHPCVLLDPNSYDWSDLDPEVTPTRRPIYYPPAVIRGDTGNYFVFVGTGDEQQPNSTTSRDFFYEVEDPAFTAGGGSSGCTGTVNWVEPLPAGEKVLAKPVVFNYVAYFTTYLPSLTCQAGTGYLWGLRMSRGVRKERGGEAGIEFSKEGTRLGQPVKKIEIGAGVPSSPVVTNGNIYVSTSNEAGEKESIKRQRITPIYGVIRGWRELF